MTAEFLLAIEAGNVEQLRGLIKQQGYATVDRSYFNGSLLGCAVFQRNREMVQAIVELAPMSVNDITRTHPTVGPIHTVLDTAVDNCINDAAHAPQLHQTSMNILTDLLSAGANPQQMLEQTPERMLCIQQAYLVLETQKAKAYTSNAIGLCFLSSEVPTLGSACEGIDPRIFALINRTCATQAKKGLQEYVAQAGNTPAEQSVLQSIGAAGAAATR